MTDDVAANQPKFHIGQMLKLKGVDGSRKGKVVNRFYENGAWQYECSDDSGVMLLPVEESRMEATVLTEAEKKQLFRTV